MIELKKVSRTFRGADDEVRALHDVSITVETGEVFGIIGPSGAGKSTLLRCINLLERPDSGSVVIDGTDLMALDRRQLRDFRRNVGVVFQQFNLLPQKTVAANVRYPLDIAGMSHDKADMRVKELLQLIGLNDKAKEYPRALSGGQQQRVAIARALASGPNVLLCDECTSALDPVTTDSILTLLKGLNRDLGMTIVIVTHDMGVVDGICDRVALICDGRLVAQDTVEDGYDDLIATYEESVRSRE